MNRQDSSISIQAGLLATQEQQSFLLKLTDALRPLADAAEIQATTTRLLGQHMDVDRCMYGEVEGVPGEEVGTIRGQYVRSLDAPDPTVIPFPDHFAFKPFGAETMPARYRGDDLVVADVRTDCRFGAEERAAWAAAQVCAAIVVPLVKGGRLVAEFGVQTVVPRRWTDGEVALVRDVAERTWAAAERARVEAALTASEEKFRTLFEAMDEGYLLAEVLQDQASGLTDIRYLEANAAAVRLADRDFVGRRMREIDPTYEQYWYDLYEQVALSGEPVRRELHAGPHDRFDVYLFKVGDRRSRLVAGIFRDVTERKRAEAALREAEERQRFLLALGDAMRAQSSASGKIEIAARHLGERLKASRVLYGEYDWSRNVANIFNGWFADGAQPFPTLMQLEGFEGQVLNDLKAGRTVRVDDVGLHVEEPSWAAIADVGVGALLSVPLLVDGTLQVNVSVHQHLPRRWSDQEVALVQEVAERLWAEVVRARTEAALRESEERFRQFGENSTDTLWIINAETLAFEYLSPAFETLWGEPRERMLQDVGRWRELVHPEDRERASHAWPSALAGERINVEYRIVRADGEVRWVHDSGFPIRNADGTVVRIAGIAKDITSRRKAEELQGTLLAELQHRVRNILAMLRSIARRTARTTHEVDDYVSHLEGRISAMARVQAMLTREPGRGVSLRTLILDEMEAEAASPEQYRLNGPEVDLAPKAAEVLSLAVHELATNSVKYGALSEPGRVICVTWTCEPRDGQDWLRFRWNEPFVGAFTPPSREGFGTELIQRRVPYELRGTGTLDFSPDAVLATIEFPLSEGRSILETGGTQGYGL